MKKGNYKQLILLVSVAISVLVFIAAAFLGQSKLSDKSSHLVDLKLQSKKYDDELVNLAATKKQLQKYAYFNTVAKTVLPNDKDQAPAVVDIYQKAQKSGIALQGIIFPSSSLGGRSISTATGSTSPSTSTPAPSSDSSALSAASLDLTQTKPVSGISGLYSLQLTITPQTGQQVPSSQLTTYDKLISFLNQIENDRRTAQITQIDIQPTSYGLNFTLVINIFIKP